MQKEYRFEFKIADAETGEVTISGSTYVSEIADDGGCESVEMEVFAALRALKNKMRQQEDN